MDASALLHATPDSPHPRRTCRLNPTASPVSLPKLSSVSHQRVYVFQVWLRLADWQYMRPFAILLGSDNRDAERK